MLSDFLIICEQAARAGGSTLLEWQGRFTVREKGIADLVTEADLAAQEAIRRIVLGAFPEHGFIGEEGGDASSSAPNRWIVDPLDGTTNFVHGVPHFAVSIALECSGRLEAATVFDPVSGECYTAGRGRGAWLNGKRLKTSPVRELRNALLASSFPVQVPADSPLLAAFVDQIQICQGLRRGGSAALNLAYVAAGRYDVYWAADLKPWDAAAGALLVTEAGGVLTGLEGGKFDVWNPRLIAAATPLLHREMVERLAKIPRLLQGPIEPGE